MAARASAAARRLLAGSQPAASPLAAEAAGPGAGGGAGELEHGVLVITEIMADLPKHG